MVSVRRSDIMAMPAARLAIAFTSVYGSPLSVFTQRATLAVAAFSPPFSMLTVTEGFSALFHTQLWVTATVLFSFPLA